jgi:hypothetical protein
MGKELLDHRCFQDRRVDLQLATAVRAVLEIEIEDAFEQTSPARPMRPMRTDCLALSRLPVELDLLDNPSH